ncbi:hypothetical protein [Plantactinospora sp. GCM10030261]|uniref:Tc toxin subunit A-related protein n=1 Tax=Plantactinospora sp. GCM10030261 TaxID=3273420 RepID=UPI00361E0278
MAIDLTSTLAPSYHATWLAERGPQVVAQPEQPAVPTVKKVRLLKYRFHNHTHPYVTELVNRLITGSVRGLQDADTATPPLREELFTTARYAPSGLLVVNDQRHKHPVHELDFSSSGAYSAYNWELFYHVPLTIAVHLSRSQRYADAQRWLHHIFDPTDDSDHPTPDRYWKVRPFREGDPTLIERVLANLSTGADPKLWEETVDAIGRWKDTPFRPHAVARYRHTSFMLKAVMSYLDNLIGWGDDLFRQDTGESINEATQLYVLAANLLGPRPQEVPSKGQPQPQTYASLRGKLDEFGNALAEVEVDLPFDTHVSVPQAADGAPVAALRSVATSLYFCVPRNDKLLGYWDTVADRLFKIRNSLDIHGVFRRLPLFDPPIDPALLAKAAAAGLDVGAIVAGLGQPLPLVRFTVLAAKAAEICHEVKTLGGMLLATIEKQDAEALAILRARHETGMLRLGEAIRYGQWQESVKAREGLEMTFHGAVARLTYYERLLGTEETDIDVPALDQLDTDALLRLRLSAREPELAHRTIDVDIEDTDVVDTDGRKLSTYEAKELDLLWGAQILHDTAAGLDAIAAIVGFVPQVEGSAKPWGIGVGVSFGGVHLKQVLDAGSAVARGIAGRLSFEANQAAKIGTYQRREQEWTFQRNVVASEITQIYRQWRAAQIREALAEREWRNHQEMIRHAEEVERFLTDPKTGKTSNHELYAWLRREVRGLYGQYFQFAYDVAKRAERALQHELGDPHQTFLSYGYQAGKEGLLAGEKLYLDLKRMEMAYHEQNRREYELTTHVSLRQLDPVALLRLRATGSCEFTVSEDLFDLIGCPGHYFRRLRSVALSIPCVVGPYTGVNATLTLQGSSVRVSPALRDGGYARDGDGDDRFSDHFGGVQSVVTSAGTNDSGMFEVNLRDDRYLPFEGTGAISRWRLELPTELPQFDHGTISDVILHLRYTARDGGAPLRAAAQTHVRDRVGQAAATGSLRLLSVRHEFPTEWARFTAAELDGGNPEARLSLTLRDEHYPYWARAVGAVTLHGFELFAEPDADTPPTVAVSTAPPDDPGRAVHELVADTALGGLRVGALADDPLPAAVGPLTLHLNDNSMNDLWLALTWGGEPA